MKQPHRILIVQTAFLGDVILTLPLAQILHRHFPSAAIDFLTTPRAAEVLHNHPVVHELIEYDKRKSEKGIGGMLGVVRKLRERSYEIALLPHRSVRSSLIVSFAGIPIRAGFSIGAGRMLYSHVVPYRHQRHEIERNLAFLEIFNIIQNEKELPSLYPSDDDRKAVDKFLFETEILREDKLIGVAPGSIWNTKRWLAERFSDLGKRIALSGYSVIVIGGTEDAELCSGIVAGTGHKNVFSAAGKLTLLQSAELIRRCQVLVSNDSAPMHIAVAMRTRVVAIFGATVPSFGFGPYGDGDVVIERKDLSCKPCTIHGGKECPIGTFDCMKGIEAGIVFEKVMEVAE